MNGKPDVVLALGSKSDEESASESDLYSIFETLGINYALMEMSAHRHPDALRDACRARYDDGARIFIAYVGLKPDLPGAIAAAVPNALVIGVAKTSPQLGVLDPAGSIAVMPPGTPVAVAGYNAIGLTNAAILACQALAIRDDKVAVSLAEFLRDYKAGPAADVPIQRLMKKPKESAQ